MNNNLLDNISISIEEIFSHIKMALIFVIFLGTIYAIIFTLMGEMKRIPVLGSLLFFYPAIYAIFAFILGFIVMHLGILKLVLPIATLYLIKVIFPPEISEITGQALVSSDEESTIQIVIFLSSVLLIPLFFDVFFRRWRIYKNYVMFPKLTIFLNILYYLVWGGITALGIFGFTVNYFNLLG